MEAPIYAFHQPLPASKTVLSSWSLVVICPPIAPDATGITGWYDNRLVVPEVPLYKFENIGYLQGTRAPPVCYVLVSRMYEYSYLHPWHQVLLLLLLWRKCLKQSRKQGTTYRDNEGENTRGTRYCTRLLLLLWRKILYFKGKRQKAVYHLVSAPQGGTQKHTLAFAYDSPR